MNALRAIWLFLRLRTRHLFRVLLNAVRTIPAVLGFECRRVSALPRLIITVGLVIFPGVLAALVHYCGAHVRDPEPLRQPERWTFMMFVLVPEVVCLLGLLLWATPVIQTEVEGKTWPYLAVRPCGKVPILLGKYLTAVVWTVLAAWLALVLSLIVVIPSGKAHSGVLVLGALVVLSALTYGALYVLIGVLFLRRSMIVAVAYTFVFEFLVSWIPAMVKQFTVQYHLRNLAAIWLPSDYVSGFFLASAGTAPWWQHVLILLGMTAVFLTAAALVLRRRQLITAPEV